MVHVSMSDSDTRRTNVHGMVDAFVFNFSAGM